ncbi:hypothetical protein [Acidiplasma sp.]|uniref:hypothetical protein n=1 Tax=Acidiplasma sp. TaxID=1872114 RepID=UPI00258D02B4|nr:hypothetical protein [Acidiplasma sp.]
MISDSINYYGDLSASSTTSQNSYTILTINKNSIKETNTIRIMEIEEIIVNGKTIMFKKPIKFEIKDDPLIPGNKYIEDNLIYIHETASTEKELKEKVKEDIEIQWEDIVMEDDSKLSEGSIKLKEHLLSFV